MTARTVAVEDPSPRQTTNIVACVRIAIGFVRGMCAWLLLKLVEASGQYYTNLDGRLKPHLPVWAEQHPMLFAAMTLITA